MPGAQCVDGVCRRQCLQCDDCASPAEACIGGYCLPAAAVECEASSDCTSPGLCESAVGAVCCGGACAYALDFGCPPCARPSDCDDNNACTTDVCLANGRCTRTFNTDPCSDDNLCTTGDTCDGLGQCVTNGVEPADTPCSDGDNCTSGDACDGAGACIGGALLCTCHDDLNNVDVCPGASYWSEGPCSPGCYKLCECSSTCAEINCDPGACTC